MRPDFRLLAIKTKQRNELEGEGDCDVHCAISKTDPLLTELVGKIQK